MDDWSGRLNFKGGAVSVCVRDRELTVLPAKLIKTNDVYVSFPVQCRRGSV